MNPSAKICIVSLLATAIAAHAEINNAPAGQPAAPDAGETITVTTVADVVDFASPETVAQLPGPDGRVSFREAVAAANNTAGPQTIAFAIPKDEWWLYDTLALLELENGPFFVDADDTTIDFSTQAAFTGDTNPDGGEVGIYGLEPNGWGVAAIYINGNNCTVRGLGPVLQRGYALYIAGKDNRVVGCSISGPLHAGVYITGGFGGPPATGNIIGGTNPGDANTISGGSSGVRIDGPAEGNIVIGNALLSGSTVGVEVRSAPSSNLFAVNNRIGGPTAAERNIISGAGKFAEEGLPTGTQVALNSAIGTIVQGNYIGTNAAGTATYGQRGTVGVGVGSSPGTQILDNLISGIIAVGTNHFAGQRFGTGISISGVNTGIIVRGNRIGTDASGQNAVPNRRGIATSSQNPVMIGGTEPGQGNTIAFNETLGVMVDSFARGAQISGNSIYSNGGLGIDLFGNSGGGVTPNDPCDGDDGANALQNYPTLQSAMVSAGGTVVSGNFNSTANSQYRLEFFASPECDPSGNGEGATYLGSSNVTTDANCTATFQATVAPAPAGSVVTATATHLASGNTSEFSPCQMTAPAAGTPLQLVSAVSRKQHGSGSSYDLDLMTNGVAVECRSSGGNHLLIFTFNHNVMAGSAKISRGVANMSNATFSGNTMTLSLSGAAEAQMLTATLSGVSDENSQVMPDMPVSLKVLTGDANGDGTVNAGDATLIRSRSGAPVNATNFLSDLNADGFLNSGDSTIARNKSGSSVR